MAASQSLTLTVIRDQKSQTVPLAAGALLAKFTASHKMPNASPSALGDKQLEANYGAVFSNGIIDGRYRVDLGAPVAIGELCTWSYQE